MTLERVGGPLAGFGLALLLAGRTRAERLAGLALAAVGGGLLAAPLVPAGEELRVALAGLAVLAIAAATAFALRRWPWALAFGALALIPARIPVNVGGSTTKLLLPLYVLVGGAVLSLALDLVRGDARSRELGPIALPLAASVAWTGLSLAWSRDVHEGTVELLAFYLPLTFLAVGIARLPWRARPLGWLHIQLAAMALLFAGIGFYQYETRDIFQNPKVVVGNAYAPFYRVNSVFWDPSIYGRFLVEAIIASLVLVLRGRSERLVLGAAAAIVVTWLGLLISFSQSSFAALIVAVLGAAAIAWRWRAAAAVGLVAVVLVSVGVSAPQVRHELFKKSRAGLNNATSDRASLVSNGIRIAVHHPVVGVGVGGFKRAYADRAGLHGRKPKVAASHNTPVTVAAESGFPGLALFVWLVAAALLASFRRLGQSFEARAATVFGLALAAIVVHSLFYNDFFEDPTTWGLLGLAALAAATARGEPAAE